MCKLDNKKNEKMSLLFVGDPNLGEQGFRVASKYFKNITCLIWKKGDGTRKEEIRTFIRSKNWDVLVSFYNDLVFKKEELSKVHLALNIHPSFPWIRGVAYDTLPLIERHKKFGATLHYITEEIDAGRIIDILQDEIQEDITHSQFRLLTQKLCLEMLEKTLKSLSGFDYLAEVYEFFGIKAKEFNMEWSSSYLSRKQLNNILDELKRREPTHCVFR